MAKPGKKTSLAQALTALVVASSLAAPAPAALAQSNGPKADAKKEASQNPCAPGNPCGPAKKKKKKQGSDNPCAPANPCAPKK